MVDFILSKLNIPKFKDLIILSIFYRVLKIFRIELQRINVVFNGTEIDDQEFLSAINNNIESIESFLVHIKTRRKPLFYLDQFKKDSLLLLIKENDPSKEQMIIALADKICNHTFNLLGSGPSKFCNNIEWHTDFKSGFRWKPNSYFADIPRAPYPGGFDIKVPWELSRCQHFSWLGQAYWFTGDEKYTKEFISEILDWIKKNPPQFGVNWACTMDVAIRAVNWLWGYYFFKDSPYINNDFIIPFFKSLLAHGRHIFNNLEIFWTSKGRLTSNHYLANIIGLIYLGILLPEFRESKSWKTLGIKELEEEISNQVYSDGVDFEGSTSYHRLVSELIISAVMLANLNGIKFSKPSMNRIEKMLEFIMIATKPDGTVPLIGDNDNGRVHRLKIWTEPDREWVDYRYLLAIGAILFERRDFALAAGDQWEEAYWLWGQKAQNFKKLINQNNSIILTKLDSHAFTIGGYYIIREKNDFMLVDAGQNGQNGFGGHAHNDIFSFELYSKDRTWIVDPGTYVYTADYESRNVFRSTAYHNTVMVDREEQNPFSKDELFRMNSDAKIKVIRWENSKDSILLVCEHDGYRRLSKPTTHRRTILFDKQQEVWVIQDRLFSDTSFDQPRASSFLHLATGLQILKGEGGQCYLLAKDSLYRFSVFLLSSAQSKLGIRKAWISPGYGKRIQSKTIEWSWSLKCDFALAPYKIGDEKLLALRVDKAHQKLYEIINID